MNSAGVAQVISQNYGQAGLGMWFCLVEKQWASKVQPFTQSRRSIWEMRWANTAWENAWMSVFQIHRKISLYVIWRLCRALWLYPKWIKQYMRPLLYDIGNHLAHDCEVMKAAHLLILYWCNSNICWSNSCFNVMFAVQLCKMHYSRSLLRH